MSAETTDQPISPLVADLMTARWGICGENWTAIRTVRDREAAYGWAHELIRKAKEAAIVVYVDRGDGWTFVARITSAVEVSR